MFERQFQYPSIELNLPTVAPLVVRFGVVTSSVGFHTLGHRSPDSIVTAGADGASLEVVALRAGVIGAGSRVSGGVLDMAPLGSYRLATVNTYGV